MKVLRSLALALTPIVGCACAASQAHEPQRFHDTASQAEKRGDFHFLLGPRQLEDDEAWEDLDEQTSVGVIWSAEPAGSWIGWEVGLLGSWKDTTVRAPNGPEATADLDTSLVEGSLGVVKSVLLGERLRPYVGAGAAVVHVEYETPLDGTSAVLGDEDELFGGYARGGFLFQWTDSSHFGLDYRVFRGGSSSLAGARYDADYAQLALVFGASF